MSNPDADTESLDPDAEVTVTIHGRKFQQMALERGASMTPVDEEEKERLDAQHLIFQDLFDQRLIFPPINDPERILDCGYGSGAWAVDVAEKYPDCEVIGVDMSPHMRPEEYPPNLWLQCDDLNEPFTFPANRFDVVHSQLVIAGIKRDRWSSYFKDCARHWSYTVLKPGGWLQCVELRYQPQSDNGTITDNHACRQFLRLMAEAAEQDGKDFRAPLYFESLMREAGLVELGTRQMQVPLNGWPADEKLRSIGIRFGNVVLCSLVSHAIIPLTDVLEYSYEELHVMVARARMDLTNERLKPYFTLHISIGRKPNS